MPVTWLANSELPLPWRGNSACDCILDKIVLSQSLTLPSCLALSLVLRITFVYRLRFDPICSDYLCLLLQGWPLAVAGLIWNMASNGLGSKNLEAFWKRKLYVWFWNGILIHIIAFGHKIDALHFFIPINLIQWRDREK